MQINTIKQILSFGNMVQAQAVSSPNASMGIGYSARTTLPFDPGEKAIKVQTEQNGSRTYFYGNVLGEITNSTTYRGNRVIKRAKYDTTTKHKIEEKKYFVSGGVRISTFDKGNGGIKHKAEYDGKGSLFEEDTFDPKTKIRLSNLRYDRIDPNCYTFRKFDSETGDVIFKEVRFKEGKNAYKTESEEFKPRKK